MGGGIGMGKTCKLKDVSFQKKKKKVAQSLNKKKKKKEINCNFVVAEYNNLNTRFTRGNQL